MKDEVCKVVTRFGNREVIDDLPGWFQRSGEDKTQGNELKRDSKMSM